MSEEKSTPENFEKGWEIFNIPTIIFLKNGIEINRFVEFPKISLESDIIKSLKGGLYPIRISSSWLRSKALEEIELMRESALIVSKTFGHACKGNQARGNNYTFGSTSRKFYS